MHAPKLVALLALAACGLLPVPASAFHPPNCNCYYPVWAGGKPQETEAGPQKTELDSVSPGSAGTRRTSGPVPPVAVEDNTCAGDAAKKRELIDLQIKKVKLEIDRLEGTESAEDAESLAAVLGALSALPKALHVLDDLRKTIRGLRDMEEIPPAPPSPVSDMGEITDMLKDIRANMVTKTQLKSELDALEQRIQEKLDKKADK